MSINFDRKQVGAGQWYTGIDLTNFEETKINHFLGLTLYLPVALVQGKVHFFINGVSLDPSPLAQDKLDKDTFVSLYKFENNDKSFTLKKDDKISLYVDASTNFPDVHDLSKYMKQFVLEADKFTSSYCDIIIKGEADNLNEFANIYAPIDVHSLTGKFVNNYEVLPKSTQTDYLLPNKYKLSTKEICNADHTLYCTPILKVADKVTDEFIVSAGTHNEIEVSFKEVKHYGAVSFKIDIIEGLEHMEYNVSAELDGANYDNFKIRSEELHIIPKLPKQGTLKIAVAPVYCNNKTYKATKTIHLDGSLQHLTLTEKDFEISEENTTGFVSISVCVNTSFDFANNFQSLHLFNDSTSYHMLVELKAGKSVMPVKIAPGTYQVRADNFIIDKTVYSINNTKKLTISNDSNLITLNIEKGTNLTVKGFDDYLGFGGCANLSPDNIEHFFVSKTNSIFKYAGVGGDGDPTVILKDDTSTRATITLAHDIEKEYNNVKITKNVLPFMISYTAQLSGGDPKGVFQNITALTNSLANYILTLSILAAADKKHTVPGGIIINPDMIGALAQNNNTSPNDTVPVTKILNDALEARKDIIPAHIKIPEDITQDIKGYVRAINWLTRTIAPQITFGWQVNLWGILNKNSLWVYDEKADPAEYAKIVAQSIKDYKAYEDDKYKPDFLAVDRYEADDFTGRAYKNQYCYGPREWDVYFEFCSALSLELKLPIMPWQIPSSKTPILSDKVDASFDNQHWGTGGTYIFGDENLGADVDNIHPIMRDFSFTEHGASAIAKLVGDTPALMYQRKIGFDVSKPAYRNFPINGIFHVQLGGGSTVGMVPPADGGAVDLTWINSKLAKYAKAPVTFKDTPYKK